MPVDEPDGVPVLVLDAAAVDVAVAVDWGVRVAAAVPLDAAV